MMDWIQIGIFSILLIAVVIFGVYSLFKINASSQWPSTEGKIRSSEIKEIEREVKNTRGDWETKREYEVVLKYEYRVDGKTFMGDRLFLVLPSIFSTRAEANQTMEKYPVNQTAMVYYDPKNPNDSTLLTGNSIPPAAFIALAIIGVIVVVLIALALFYFGNG